MPATYTLIASNTLSSSAASVTFSAIPATYTDLVCRMSVRNNWAAASVNFFITYNGSSSSDYSATDLRGNGSAASSTRDTSTTSFTVTQNGDTSTSNTFSSFEMYVPNYASSTNKVGSFFAVMETNATQAFLSAEALLRSNTAAITSLGFSSSVGDFMAGSSFFLYGIKNS